MTLVIGVCPHCGGQVFPDVEELGFCLDCGARVYRDRPLATFGGGRDPDYGRGWHKIPRNKTWKRRKLVKV